MKLKSITIFSVILFSLLIGGCSSELSYQNPPHDKRDKIEETNLEQPKTLISIANEINILFKNREMNKLAQFVHPDKGLLFSPYGFISKESLVFTRNQVDSFFDDSTVYIWGTFDGSGEPIKLIPKEYYSRFIYDRDYSHATEIIQNQIKNRGNTMINLHDVFPDAEFIEYYIKGSDEYSGMDWRSFILVFEKYDHGWYLVGAIHNEWTT